MSASPWRSPWTWYGLALLPMGIGYFMYALQEDGNKRLRLSDPVPAMGSFVKAECLTSLRGNMRVWMNITYAFVAPDYKEYVSGSNTPQPRPDFKTGASQKYSSLDDCEAALPAVRAARTPHQVWYERNTPSTARTSLEEVDSKPFLFVCLGAIPLALVGLFLGWRRHP